MKKVLLFLSALALLFPFAACGGGQNEEKWEKKEGQIGIGFSQVGAESDWRLANTKSMRETFTEENGYYLKLLDAQQQTTKQVAHVRWFIEKKADYIVIAPTTEDGWDAVLGEAKAAGIPIIVDRMINTADESLYTCWVGSDFRKEGDLAVEWMEKTFAGRESLKIVHLQGTMGSSAQIGRTEGLEEGVENNAGWEIVHQKTAGFTETTAKEVMDQFLAGNPAFDVLYCENDNMAFGAIDALKAVSRAYGIGGGVTIISFDATRKGLEYTLDGKINFNVECNPLHGPRVEAIIKQLEKGEKPEKKVFVEEETFDAADITQEIVDARSY